MIRKILILLLTIGATISVKAQLSDLHYLPPLKQSVNNAAVEQQAIYLSTPETTAFTVTAYLGTSTAPLATFSVVKGAPITYDLPDGDNDITLVTDANTGIVLANSGLRFESAGEEFYVNYRGVNSSQAASLTSKGRAAAGQSFKWGGVPNIGTYTELSTSLGIMATEDNTQVLIFDYDPDCVFRLGANRGGITNDQITITLDAGESYVLEAHQSEATANIDGWLGASITSDKDIVISNGGLLVQTISGNNSRDVGIDQPVPEDALGKEYLIIRGNGGDSNEFASVIGVFDNTDIYINGSALPVATIDEGEYYLATGNNFTGTTTGSNMYIETSQDVYLYQNIAGSTATNTSGLNFIAPLHCLMDDHMDNIPDITDAAGTTLTGGISITASTTTPDANIIVTDGTGVVALPASQPAVGNTEWKTYALTGLTGDVSVYSSGPIAVGFFGSSGARGIAGYFSGFDNIPDVDLQITGGIGCFPNSSVAEVTGNFDAYQWYYDGQLQVGENGTSYAPTQPGVFYVEATKGPCTYDSNEIYLYYCDSDIILNKTVDKSDIIEGETVTFTIEVTNFGVDPLTNLIVTDNIPAGLTFVSAYTLEGSWSGSNWNIGTLNSGETATLELEVIGDEIDTDVLVNLINTATHTQDQVDANYSEDIPSTRITIHNDFDNDGVEDLNDVDDDNDGVEDSDECLITVCFEPIVNESFESPVIGSATYNYIDESLVDGWSTTATNSIIEFWSDGFLGVNSYDGNQFAELNASESSALYQNLCLTPGTTMNWSLRHRGRNGVDVMQVRIGADLTNATVQGTMSDDNNAWGYYSGTYTVPMTQVNTIFIFEAVSTATGSLASGNFIDDIEISVAAILSCTDTDGDGYPDNIDLDSDDDGCSDANEWYIDENADGGDDQEYGTGAPAVDPITGAVIAASYVKVVAPEILLTSTSEDLGGTDINGQDVSLGQTLDYVLRFQTTGDDDAVNYTIRNVLPDNITLDNVDVTGAPGTTYIHDITTQTINFDIPDSLVEMGDPEYTIRFTVTLDLNCSNFVDVCSSTLENIAYSTYQGLLNTSTFTDEAGSYSISGCAVVNPAIASNSILSDLTSCNQARTVQLCGDDVTLTAGSGFTTYNWVLDNDGNGQVDATDTVLNDGDPDNDPSTLLVSVIGDYIVEKSAGGTCPDLIELITVEAFGTTQTNPIEDYFNQVNSDANSDNDIQGEIVSCSVDGDILPKIFLCGVNDEAVIQLGITDAQSIAWEKLDETSCTGTTDDCANKNGTCTWNVVDNDDNYTLDESGYYRVVIIYQNGCFSRFYFNVFKNELDIQYNTSDILCTTPGNIIVTNIGSAYGFQLLDATTDTILIPFSSNNGSNFDITTNGTYRVQVAALDPSTGLPISGACVFETEDIGIIESNFQVDLITTPADCNQLGTITVQALNVLPNYSYELYLDDGTNSGAGTLVSSQPTNTGNTYTFSNINPEDYIVVTETQDGCYDSQQITVTEIPDLTLTAINSQNISCASGIATLTPDGGTPDYQMAIWSKDGVDLYASPADINNIPASELQDTPNILFRNSTDAGEYVFIVFDDNNCFAFSNAVTIIDLGTPVVSATHTTITCADSATSELKVTVTGGTTPYQYSLDGGVTYQTTDTFVNLAAGIYTITVMDNSNNAGTGCTETLVYEIDQPYRLTASASIVEDASCNTAGALVKIINANGGQAPYQYSFDGGSSFSTNNELNLSSGTYDLVIQDDLGCTYDMEITVPAYSAAPSFNSDVAYDCDGAGNISITPSNVVDFAYTYALNGTANTPVENNTFSNVAVGNQIVTVGYSNAINADQCTLIFENFGSGPNTKIGEIGPDYCYEPQDGTTTTCNLGPAGILSNGEYTVTNLVTNPNTSFLSPNDHSGLTDGRFLAIDVSSNAGVNGILWSRYDIEVLQNQDIDISFWAYNLMQTSGTGDNPKILIELLDATGAIISSTSTAEIPKNTNADDWTNRTITVNPGTNTTVSIVFRSDEISDVGNDLILDDIQASQKPEVCDITVDITVVIEDNKAFEANLLGTTDPSCNGSSDGAIRFEVLNFDTVTGFEYSTDGGTNWTTSLVSPITTSATLADGSYTVLFRKVSDNTCVTDFNATLTEPATIVPQLNEIAAYTCLNTGATLEASAAGGFPAYEYQLEDTSGTIIVAYQTTIQFTDITDGDYVVRVRDQNGCDAVSTTTVTIAPPTSIVFDVTPTDCYSGINDGEILINVTAGNGNYEFRLDAGAWITPTPVTDTSYTFTGLSNGSYDVEVRDQLGCPLVSNTQTVVIGDQLIVDVDVVEISACGDGSITVNATGGSGTLSYAIVPANDSPVGLYSATNSLTITEAMATANPSGYDVYVQDNNGSPALCSFVQEDIILLPVTTLSVTATPTDPECFDGLGFIEVTVTGGTAPYTYALADLSPADGIDYSISNTNISTTTHDFYGIGVGNYEVTITDTNTCAVISSTVTINDEIEITADIVPILPANCSSTIESDYGFEFTNITSPTGTVEYSNDGGTTWQASFELTGTAANPTFSGTEVFPSIRVEVSPGVYCQKDFDKYIIPFPLDDLDITLSAIIVGCNDLQVTVEGSAGDDTSGYDYTYTDDPGNFNTFILDPAVWIENIATGTPHTFQNLNSSNAAYPEVPLLVPGRTYVFYVRDGSGCIRQSSVNVNDIPLIDLPIEITTDITPSCDGMANGIITFNLTPANSFPTMRWSIYELGNTTPIEVSGAIAPAAAVNVPYNAVITTTTLLAEGDYYIDIIQVDASGTDQCQGASENTYVSELAPLAATAVVTRDISCNLPGLISITGISGGGGAPYAYDVTGPVGFTASTGSTDNPVQIPVNSPAGDYTVTLHDQYSCSLVLNTVALTLSANPTLTVSQDNCASPIGVTVVGSSAAGNLRYAMVSVGAAPTTYEDNGGLFTNVSVGSYDVYVTDGNGCTNLQSAFEVYPVLSVSTALTKLLDCTTSADADINIEILDGSGSYEYSITSTSSATPVVQTAVPSTNFTYQAPLAGDYTVTIYDTNSPNSTACNREFTINVPDRIEPIIDLTTLTVTDITCIGDNDGTITISTSNTNAAPYTFEITSLDGTAISILPTNTAGTLATFTGLAPTTTTAGYIITVTGEAATNNCSVDSASIIILEPATVSFAVPTVTSFGCTTGNSTNNAGISIDPTTITGGSGTYIRYEFIDVATGNTLQDGTNSDYIFTDLLGGDVRVIVHDDNSCFGEVTVTVPAFDVLGTPTVTIDNAISCSGLAEDISIDILSSVTNYASNPSNYEFTHLAPSGSGVAQATNTFLSLGIGDHTFVVKNISTGCEVTVAHSVADPNTFGVIVEKLADVVCFGDNGSIRLLMSDATYTSSFSWSIYDTNGTPADRTDDGTAISTGTSPDFGPTAAIDVPAGNFLVEVIQDAFPSCGQTETFTITTPSAALDLDPIDLSNVGCNDDEGSATITPTGGLAPYDITLTNNTTSVSSTVTGVNSEVFQNLTAGQYTIVVTDALGCTVTFANEFQLELPDPLSGTISATDLLCQGDVDAIITLSLISRNVTPTYSFKLNVYDDLAGSNLSQTSVSQTSAIFDNIGPGFYSITVEDDLNCAFESAIIEVIDPEEVNVMLFTSVILSCLDGADLQLTAAGGTAPYMFSDDGVTFSAINETNGPNTHLIESLPAGSYQYYIRDSFNCTSILSNEVTITAIEPLSVVVDTSAAVINCNGESTAVILASADGGLGNYQYGLFSDAGLVNQIGLYQTSETFADLPAGSYFINVQSEDCVITSQEIIVTEPTVLVVVPTITDVSCNGDDDGAVTFNATGGSGDYQYAISPNLNQFDDENTFENLTAGNYTVIVQDVKGCFELIEFSIIEPLVLDMSLTTTPEICFGSQDGTITVIVTGGTAPYSTSLNSNDDQDFVQDRLTFDSLPGDSYLIFVKDAMDCTTNMVIDVDSGINLTATAEVIYECSGSTSPTNRVEVLFEDESVSADILYGLDTVDPNLMVINSSFDNITTGLHFITIAHANGCTNTLNFEVETFQALQVTAEQQNMNEITAVATGGKEGYTYYFDGIDNGDQNTFQIYRTDTYDVRIVDENGCEASSTIYIEYIDIEVTNFFTPDGDGNNDLWLPMNIEQYPDIWINVFDRYGRPVFNLQENPEGWNGYYLENELPTGDYWYVIKLNGADDTREFVGHFTLYR